jgi:hypothetical protein
MFLIVTLSLAQNYNSIQDRTLGSEVNQLTREQVKGVVAELLEGAQRADDELKLW